MNDKNVLPFRQKETIDLLLDGLESGKLTGWSADKARDLISFYGKKRAWASEKQEAFARSLLFPKKREATKLGDLTGVLNLLRAGAKHKKWPRIVLLTNAAKIMAATDENERYKLFANGGRLVLKLAGPDSKYAGSLTVTDGGPFGDNVWYGRITPEGVFEQTFKKLDDMADVCDTLRALADDPVAIVSVYGKVTNSCCFCNRDLTDDVSIKLGFGPVCAKNHGLEWSKGASS